MQSCYINLFTLCFSHGHSCPMLCHVWLYLLSHSVLPAMIPAVALGGCVREIAWEAVSGIVQAMQISGSSAARLMMSQHCVRARTYGLLTLLNHMQEQHLNQPICPIPA